MLLQQAIAYISRKRTRNLVLFLILLLILSCLYFCFSLMQVGGRLEDHIKQSAGTSFALTSKQGDKPFSLELDLWFLNMKVPFVFLVKKR